MKKKASRASKAGPPPVFGQPAEYASLLRDIKDRIRQAQTRAVLSVNAELVRLYWDIGRIPRAPAARRLGCRRDSATGGRTEERIAGFDGFSERNIDNMIRFFRAYPSRTQFRNRRLRNYPAAKMGVRRRPYAFTEQPSLPDRAGSLGRCLSAPLPAGYAKDPTR